MKNQEEKKRGGARVGAGRKRTTVRNYNFRAIPEVDKALNSVSNKTEFINNCILHFINCPKK